MTLDCVFGVGNGVVHLHISFNFGVKTEEIGWKTSFLLDVVGFGFNITRGILYLDICGGTSLS